MGRPFWKNDHRRRCCVEERDFDIIVVGCGCAGAIAAYVAAKQGKSVLIVERGESAGSKNMTGGRIYAHSLRKVFDKYADGDVEWDNIPFERKITHERIALMDPPARSWAMRVVTATVFCALPSMRGWPSCARRLAARSSPASAWKI